jgi:two-component system nitrate/nitrite response regulator NarL
MLGHTVLPPELLTIVSNLNLNSEHDCFNGEIDAERIRGASLSIKIDDVPRLSDREKRVLQLLIEGASNKAIGRKINAAEGTVKVHVKAILRKIRARNRTQAAIWAMNNGSLIGRADVVSAPLAPQAPDGNMDFVAGQHW